MSKYIDAIIGHAIGDTIGTITGSIAAAYYGIPEDLCEKALEYLDKDLIEIHDKFYKKFGE